MQINKEGVHMNIEFKFKQVGQRGHFAALATVDRSNGKQQYILSSIYARDMLEENKWFTYFKEEVAKIVSDKSYNDYTVITFECNTIS